MGTSRSFLVRHFLHHPEHRFLLYKQVLHNPQLAKRFEAIQGTPQEEDWLEWFELLEHISPSLTKVLMQEISSLVYDSSPDFDAFPPNASTEPTFVELNQPLFDLHLGASSSETHFPEPANDKKQLAIQNSKLIYSSGPGWNKFAFHLKSGELFPVEQQPQGSNPFRCKLVQKQEHLELEELHLTFSEHRSLIYREHKWFWNNTRQIEHAIKMDIKDISRVLQADVVDLLLDLVSPGLIYQGSDAYLSVSIISAELPKNQKQRLVATLLEDSDSPKTNEQKQALEVIFGQELSPPDSSKKNPANVPLDKPLPPDTSFLSSGEKVALTRSPFAFSPRDDESGETTQNRKAFLEPKTPPPQPKELKIERNLPAITGWRAWFKSNSMERETLAVIKINETKIFKELGFQVTFLVESTADTIFPWVRITRSAKFNTEATIKLQWNGEQEQNIPPNYKSTGALSRSQVLGQLHVTIQSPNQMEQKLFISWLP